MVSVAQENCISRRSGLSPSKREVLSIPTRDEEADHAEQEYLMRKKRRKSMPRRAASATPLVPRPVTSTTTTMTTTTTTTATASRSLPASPAVITSVTGTPFVAAATIVRRKSTQSLPAAMIMSPTSPAHPSQPPPPPPIFRSTPTVVKTKVDSTAASLPPPPPPPPPILMSSDNEPEPLFRKLPQFLVPPPGPCVLLVCLLSFSFLSFKHTGSSRQEETEAVLPPPTKRQKTQHSQLQPPAQTHVPIRLQPPPVPCPSSRTTNEQQHESVEKKKKAKEKRKMRKGEPSAGVLAAFAEFLRSQGRM